jgi:hypothetical protein
MMITPFPTSLFSTDAKSSPAALLYRTPCGAMKGWMSMTSATDLGVDVDDRDLVTGLGARSIGAAAVGVGEEEPTVVVVARQFVRLGDQASQRPYVLAEFPVEEVDGLVEGAGGCEDNGALHVMG